MMTMTRGVPSLVDLCVQVALDNIRYLGDVGETDLHLLERILPHCTIEQLRHIENSTEGRDLSPVTNELWKKFFESHFGANSTKLVMERMKTKKVTFKWKQLYEAKMKDLEEAQQQSSNRIKELYKKETEKKQSRQIRICTKVPPSSNKRSFCGGPGSGFSNMKSGLMKKAKIDFLNSHEVKNIAAMKKNALPRNHNNSVAAPIRKPGAFGFPEKRSSSSSASSSSKTVKPAGRRF